MVRLHASSAGGVGSIPGQETKIPCVVLQPKKKENCRCLREKAFFLPFPFDENGKTKANKMGRKQDSDCQT